MTTRIYARNAQPGDVVLAASGEVYQAPPDPDLTWSAMAPTGAYGPVDATAPKGELILLVRDGKAVAVDA